MTSTQSTLVQAEPQAQSLPAIKPVTGVIGATVTGFDLQVEPSPEARRLLVRSLQEHGVLFVRFGRELSQDDHLRLAGLFGEIEENHARTDNPRVSVIDNAKRANVGTERWHADTTVVAKPPGIALLRAITLPEVGGDTMWADMRAVYEALSPKMQRFLEGLEAVHTTETLLRARPAARATNLFAEERSTVHPVVIRTPGAGKPALYVNSNYVSQIVGLTDSESASLLKMLFDLVNTPEFHVRHTWDTQTIAVWDERATQHRAVSDYSGHRVMNSVWVKGAAPEAYGDIAA